MVKFIRFSKANGSINIGTKDNKLTIFTRQKMWVFYL